MNHLNFLQLSLWNERGRTISKIREIYPDTHRIKIMNILNDAEKIISHGELYKAERKKKI